MIDLLKKNHGCDRETQKWNHGEKIAKPGEILSSNVFEQHAMLNSKNKREKRERTMTTIITQRKLIAMISKNVNLAKKFGMNQMTMEKDDSLRHMWWQVSLAVSRNLLQEGTILWNRHWKWIIFMWRMWITKSC